MVAARSRMSACRSCTAPCVPSRRYAGRVQGGTEMPILQPGQRITDEQFDNLKGFIDRGDRGGFYLYYYELTGSSQSLIQAHISTYS